MKQFFTNPITIIVGLLILAAIISVIGYNKWGWFRKKIKLSNGTPPDPSDCGGMRMATQRATERDDPNRTFTAIVYNGQSDCTRPNYFPEEIEMESCVTIAQLNNELNKKIKIGDELPRSIWAIDDNDKAVEVFLNRQSGLKFCYIVKREIFTCQKDSDCPSTGMACRDGLCGA